MADQEPTIFLDTRAQFEQYRGIVLASFLLLIVLFFFGKMQGTPAISLWFLILLGLMWYGMIHYFFEDKRLGYIVLTETDKGLSLLHYNSERREKYRYEHLPRYALFHRKKYANTLLFDLYSPLSFCVYPMNNSVCTLQIFQNDALSQKGIYYDCHEFFVYKEDPYALQQLMYQVIATHNEKVLLRVKAQKIAAENILHLKDDIRRSLCPYPIEKTETTKR